MLKQKVKNLIIGAGPAGLAVAGRMRQRGVDFEILEQSNKIAVRWHEHYDRLLLHTVKELSHLPHLPFPENYPTYVARLDLVKYYENYAKQFDIQPHFEVAVTSIQSADNNWIVSTKDGKSFVAERVIVATGVNRVPRVPKWEGQDSYKGKIIHSRKYKNVQPFENQRVLIIGMGNTGAELALDFSENNIDVTIAVRSPITIVPRDVNGRPVQRTAKMLDKIPFGIGNWLGTQIRKAVIGDLSKYGVPMSTVHPVVQLKKTGKTPVIDLGTAKHIKQGKIKVVGDIEKFYEDGVVLKGGERRAFDAVVLATGYRPQLADFLKNVKVLLDKNGCPRSPIGTNEHQGLYFIGFDNYKLGGILGTVFNDSATIVEHIVNHSTAPSNSSLRSSPNEVSPQ
ncbi:MAG: NAD(P)/FAD-dependent oxidoreductase [Bacteroidota bacterium]